jgi:hypothetical protein
MGHENTTILIDAYDEHVLLPLTMQVYKSSLPFVEKPQTFKSPNGGNFKNLFHTINTTAHKWTKIFGRELYGYHQYLVDANIYKCAITWW